MAGRRRAGGRTILMIMDRVSPSIERYSHVLGLAVEIVTVRPQDVTNDSGLSIRVPARIIEKIASVRRINSV